MQQKCGCGVYQKKCGLCMILLIEYQLDPLDRWKAHANQVQRRISVAIQDYQ